MLRIGTSTVGFAALLFLAPIAWAHGGQFNGPGGQVPPEVRPPSDPPPPPPPPSSGPPQTPPPSSPPAPGTPPPTQPVNPPTTPTTPGTDLGGGTTARRSVLTYESWMFWYGNNRLGIERLKENLYARIGSDNPIAVLGGNGTTAGLAGGSTQPTAAKVESHVIPALLQALDPTYTNDPDVEASAYIALAKVTRDPVHIDRLRRGLATEKSGGGRPNLVREATALALGLLRRGEAPRRFSGAELDRVRAHLFQVLEDGDEYAVRTRGFAALSLGLLGDQAYGDADAARATLQRLYDLLGRDHAIDDLPIGLLLALGLQQPANVPAGVLAGLTEGAVKGRVAGRPLSPLVQSYAVLAAAHLGDGRLARPFGQLVTNRSTSVHVRRSAAIALGVLGRLLAPDDRAAVAKHLRENLDRASDASTQNFGIMSLAYLAAADLAEGRTGVLVDARAGDFLLAEARDGGVLQRPFGALALGWVLREMPDIAPTAAHGAFRQDALLALREGLAGKALEARNRAAFAVALGMSRDLVSRSALLALVADTRADRDMRGYAAVGLGLLGAGTPEVHRVLRLVVTERASEELTFHAATALGLLRDGGAVPLLVETLTKVESQHAKGQVVIALSRIGDARAVEPLALLLADTAQPTSTRALACAGLGVVGDLEWIPSLARLRRDVNYRASVDLVAEALSIL